MVDRDKVKQTFQCLSLDIILLLSHIYNYIFKTITLGFKFNISQYLVFYIHYISFKPHYVNEV